MRPFAGPGGTSPFAPPLHSSPPRASRRRSNLNLVGSFGFSFCFSFTSALVAEFAEVAECVSVAGVEEAVVGFVTGKRKATEGSPRVGTNPHC